MASAESATALSALGASASATVPPRSSSSESCFAVSAAGLTLSVAATVLSLAVVSAAAESLAVTSVVWRVRYWSMSVMTWVNFSLSARILNSSFAVEPTRFFAVESSTPASSTRMRSSPDGEICGSERPNWSTRLRMISRDWDWISLISSVALRPALSIWRVMLVPPARSRPKLMDLELNFGFALRKACFSSPFLE